jgi:hypothetical protein
MLNAEVLVDIGSVLDQGDRQHEQHRTEHRQCGKDRHIVGARLGQLLGKQPITGEGEVAP